MIKFLRSIPEYVKAFFARYPAVLSGYIIYCYLFISIMRLFYRVKHQGASFDEVYDIFSALPFMWLLAVCLVKIIEYRTRLHENYTQQLARDKELQMKDTQLKTMHEVVKALQHKINNPLAVITLLVGRTKKIVTDNKEAIKNIEFIEQSTNSITKALEEFKKAEFYHSDEIGQLEGKIASVSKEQ